MPVVPCYVCDAPYNGTALGSFFMTARAKVRIGKPIDLSPYFERENDRSVLQELTLVFLKEIARLAGDEDFQPQLAGRHWKTGQEQEADNGINGNGNGNGDAKPAVAGAGDVVDRTTP